MSTANVPAAPGTNFPIDFGLGLAPGISAACLAAYTTAASNLITACNMPAVVQRNISSTQGPSAGGNGVATTVSALLEPATLALLCTQACTDAANGLTIALTPACGSSAILAATTPTKRQLNAANLGSYATTFNTLACIRANDGKSFCASQLAPTISSLITLGGSNTAEVLSNATFLCSECASKEIKAASAMTNFVDFNVVLPTINFVKNASTTLCSNPVAAGALGSDGGVRAAMVAVGTTLAVAAALAFF